VKAVADSLGAVCGEILDFEVAGLFEIVINRRQVRALLGKGRRGKKSGSTERENKQQSEPTEQDHWISLQVSCTQNIRLT